MNGLKSVSKCFSSNLFQLFVGLVIGFTLCSQFRTFRYQSKESSFCPFESFNGLNNEEFEDKNSVLEQLIESIGQQNEDKNLVLIGVMTANKYLDSRALSIYNTWAQNISGKIIFFSSSSSKY
jgi:chondroitin sulfate synthase